MRIFAVESSAKAASVAVCEDGVLLGQYFQNHGLTHSVTLMCMARELLRGLKLTVGNIDIFAAASGPGSFTGIRIGVATVKGLAWGAGKRVCGVSTPEAMAWLAGGGDRIICPVMDARREQVYNAKFWRADAAPVRLCEDRAISIRELVEETAAARGGAKILLTGDAAAICLPHFLEAGLRASIAPELVRQQCAFGVALAASRCTPVEPGELRPNYIRAPQAEQKRLQAR
ncbi:MAG: tRNA (adenosine(37)-N6)-threonylcarbamoyltransferase complex dimerization subunit type 1 TsaB [Oscillospiraceae bacterium]|jgi:tRNA threonylcarbamoyladenosine biosynthesis protein TsaB|nr:tRNA (adenosine(37)-N6)-threonylcarbamoyltransferase complex dimerization subunit type 1 TsaB [Oscillospiraceae bacterium]